MTRVIDVQLCKQHTARDVLNALGVGTHPASEAVTRMRNVALRASRGEEFRTYHIGYS